MSISELIRRNHLAPYIRCSHGQPLARVFCYDWGIEIRPRRYLKNPVFSLTLCSYWVWNFTLICEEGGLLSRNVSRHLTASYRPTTPCGCAFLCAVKLYDWKSGQLVGRLKLRLDLKATTKHATILNPHQISHTPYNAIPKPHKSLDTHYH